ncbi:hypothetical protein SLEP1_g48931 [Rubroshorea leprosula]|uniref:Uncharacterized protein n=1 Tax=Rubroshorea leprosula TaxID=152421 RepID=A0AAV5LXB1_9ROSI|nr:hypothetical protein SLEP1_g48931 [Rubroshorea leprosula]
MAGEIESMASNMRSKMRGDTKSSSTSCIFGIPSILRRHNKEAYIPNAFSIGPFHHGEKHLEDKEKIKFDYLQGLIDRNRDPEATLMKCIREITNYETKARECYAEEILMSKQAFIEMLVLDGCFIVEVFRKDAEELLFSLTSDWSETKSLLQLTLDFFENIFSSEKSSIQLDLFANQEIQHILDLIRSSLVLPLGDQQGQEESFVSWQPIPSATSIKDSGISFRKVKSRSILDVKFRRGALEMSPILIQETVEPAFRNLISYEQCYPNCPPRVTSYAILLDNLINNEEEMEELSKSGVLINWLNPHDTTQFFKMLYHDAFLKEFHYLKLFREVNEYQQKLWPKWRAFYIRNYFAKP